MDVPWGLTWLCRDWSLESAFTASLWSNLLENEAVTERSVLLLNVLDTVIPREPRGVFLGRGCWQFWNTFQD